MKKNVKFLAISLASAGLLLNAGCASHKADRHISVSPSCSVVIPDATNRANVDVEFNVPAHYLSKRSRIVITPQLVAGDSIIDEYSDIAVYSPIYDKKVKRLEVLEHYMDPYAESAIKLKSVRKSVDIPFHEDITLPKDIETARMIAVVTVDGCGECTGIDTINVSAFGTPTSLLPNPKNIKLELIEPEYNIRPKVVEGKGVANLQFVINKYDIRLDMGNNKQELDTMLARLAPVLSDSLATVNRLEIFGMASADGPLAFNTALSNNRAQSAKNWLASQLHLPAKVKRIIKVGSRPEGWQPVLDAMKADNHPDTVKVQEILTKYAGQNDDVAEKYIRRLSCWNDIKDRYLQKDRKVEYAYSYTIKSFTDDDELLDMYKKRPDALSEDEFLRVASLAKDDDSRKEVYQTILNYFPGSKAAANNLAIIYFNEDLPIEAQKILEGRGDLSPEMQNTLVAVYTALGDDKSALELLDKTDMPEVRYNLGLLKAQKRDYEEAYKLLRPFNDANTALVALALNKNNEASEIMSKSEDTTPLAKYVRALIAARMGQDDAVFELLNEACVDENLRRRALDEPDFLKYVNNNLFRQAIGK